ncbi:MAG: carboxypeptidase regulatory-like domain-containing protein [Pyrinomonadaceae bacterium]|nr:carboxypeptidase regulatory-like domain-containing protein [Pyrinomonadaceae bacterium]
MSKRLIATLLITIAALTTVALAAISGFRATTQTESVAPETRTRPRSVRQEVAHPGTEAVGEVHNAEGQIEQTKSVPVGTQLRPVRPEEQSWPGNGMIEGYVHNAEGQPVAGASVFIRWPYPKMGMLPGTRTDEQGKFLFSSVPPGTYFIGADNEEQGYPSPEFAVYGRGATVQQVSVVAEQVTSGVTIDVGSKVARLFGRVVDGATSKAVKNPSIILRREGGANYFYRTGGRADGTFKILAPSVPFTIEVSAPGYKSWHYKKANSSARESGLDKHGDTLHMTSSETEELTIALNPDK